MDAFDYQASEAEIVSEEGLIQHKIPFGDRYARVTYLGMVRVWGVVFSNRSAEEFAIILERMASEQPFLWVQPHPCESDGPHRTRRLGYDTTEINGAMMEIRAEFRAEMIGPKFTQEASEKFGARDTGMNRSR